MITSTDFVRQVKAIAATNPTYRTGGRGVDGTCDCIGLIMGAMYRLGASKYPMHSTNYFARYETEAKQPLKGEWQLQPGMIVYKDREDNGQLNERYKPGGRYYTGDLLDYYHVGVVASINPLEITHCTQTNNINGMARDTSVRGWTQCGWVKGVTPTEPTEEGESDMAGYQATVTAANGQPVKVRSSPNTKSEANVLTKLPVGTVVDVLEEGESDGVLWATVTSGPLRGYMMSKFLKAAQPGNDVLSEDGASVLPSDAYTKIMAKLDEILEAIAALGGAG